MKTELARLLEVEERGYPPDCRDPGFLLYLEATPDVVIVAWQLYDFDETSELSHDLLSQALAVLRWFDGAEPQVGSLFHPTGMVAYLVTGRQPSKQLHSHILKRSGLKR